MTIRKTFQGKEKLYDPTKVRSATDIIFTIGGAIRETEKAVLFKIQNPYGNDFSDFIEKWIPKSVIVPHENQSKEQREFIHKLQADTDEDTIEWNPLVVAEWFSKKLFE